MTATLLPPPAEILIAFTEEVTRAGGTVTDRLEDGVRLFARAVLPLAEEVLTHDIVSAGVAIRTSGGEILVCPFAFREVCRNGAIRGHAAEARSISRVGLAAPSEAVLETVREIRRAVRLCASKDVFRASMDEMGLAARRVGASAISMMPYVMQAGLSAGTLARIYESLMRGQEFSAFHLMNAVTSTAREEKDPEVRWQLEALGGGIPAMLPRPSPPGGAGAETAADREYNARGWATTRAR